MQNVQLNLRYHYLRVFQCHYIFCVFPHIKYHLVSKHYGILITSVKWGNYEQKKHKHTSTFIWQQTDESCFFSPDRCSIAAGVHFALAYCYMNPFSWRKILLPVPDCFYSDPLSLLFRWLFIPNVVHWIPWEPVSCNVLSAAAGGQSSAKDLL